jgi:hypothetical protein
MRIALFSIALVMFGCSSANDAQTGTASDSEPASDSGPASDSESADSSSDSESADSASDSGGAYTIGNCTTNIAADAPDFFKTYFKCVTITTTADAIVIASTALPPHLSYYYGSGSPNYAPFDTSRGSEYMPNPNKLKQRNFKISVPRDPKSKGLTVTSAMVDGLAGTSTEEYALGPAGVAIDSVTIFDATAAPGDNIETEKFTFDDYSAHPSPDGMYHYHSDSKGPLEVLASIGKSTQQLYGVMCDGTVVLGCTELDGSDPGALDAQGGHVGDIKADANTYFTSRYHTHVCTTKATGHKFTPEIQYYSSCGRSF